MALKIEKIGIKSKAWKQRLCRQGVEEKRLDSMDIVKKGLDTISMNQRIAIGNKGM